MRSVTFTFIIASLFVLAGCTGNAVKVVSGEYDGFVSCLLDKDVKMYGVYWCPHCADQKELFGDSFTLFEASGGYVECDPKGRNAQPLECTKKGITGFPTWIFSEGQRVSGTQPLTSLSELSDCPL